MYASNLNFDSKKFINGLNQTARDTRSFEKAIQKCRRALNSNKK